MRWPSTAMLGAILLALFGGCGGGTGTSVLDSAQLRRAFGEVPRCR